MMMMIEGRQLATSQVCLGEISPCWFQWGEAILRLFYRSFHFCQTQIFLSFWEILYFFWDIILFLFLFFNALVSRYLFLGSQIHTFSLPIMSCVGKIKVIEVDVWVKVRNSDPRDVTWKANDQQAQPACPLFFRSFFHPRRPFLPWEKFFLSSLWPNWLASTSISWWWRWQ